MKVITCASFYGSGSSALTDLIAEYDVVKDLTDYEFRFLHDMDGVSDLEFHLCECHNRHNSGHALKRFKRLVDYHSGNRLVTRYEPYFNGQFRRLFERYIADLTDFSYKGWWFYDPYDKGENYYYVMQALNKLVTKLSFGKIKLFRNEITYCAHPTTEDFLVKTQSYVSALLSAANPDGLPYIEIDQLLPSQHIERALRYIKEPIHVFVVDRDPRDIYILEKCYWQGAICPTDDAETFCDWFLYTRNSGAGQQLSHEQVTYLKFEDLIFHYEDMVARIEDQTGLLPSQHTKAFSKFNPKRSVNNTQLWKKHPELMADMKIIEQRLAAYLYPFEQVSTNQLPGVSPEVTAVF
ncbi:hypothetical protein [Streptococcus sp. E24BD]|uniref:hypothetical protein n=1 Tax=Streptococcus sp. E24BD TaxID=3278715 RepID=UPI00359E2951